MPTTAQLIQLHRGEGPAFSAVGDVYRILATGEQTGGAYVLSEARVLPGGGPPPHVHHRTITTTCAINLHTASDKV
jgi:hypothetical protein